MIIIEWWSKYANYQYGVKLSPSFPVKYLIVDIWQEMDMISSTFKDEIKMIVW